MDCLSDVRAFATYDVFTDRSFSGNPLAIVAEADGLTATQMQTIAREFNLSETIFVQTPEDPENTAKVRIFFPTAEIPFAGHPTVGCAIYLATKSAPEGDFTTEIRLEEQAGLVPVTVTRRAGVLRAEFEAPVIPAPPSAGDCPDAGLLATALGLGPDEIGFGRHKPGLWAGGPAFLYAPVRDLEALAKARLHEPAWSQVTAKTGLPDVYVYTADGAGYRARMYAPGAGIPEDPATGSASAILSAQLLASGALEPGETRLTLRQGVEMGRPSQIDLRVICRQEAVEAVYVTGGAVPISSGEILIPPAG